eukprot:scaffold146531_cov17-Tisochrysis_lutea.AAC.2
MLSAKQTVWNKRLPFCMQEPELFVDTVVSVVKPQFVLIGLIEGTIQEPRGLEERGAAGRKHFGRTCKPLVRHQVKVPNARIPQQSEREAHKEEAQT